MYSNPQYDSGEMIMIKNFTGENDGLKTRLEAQLSHYPDRQALGIRMFDDGDITISENTMTINITTPEQFVELFKYYYYIDNTQSHPEGDEFLADKKIEVIFKNNLYFQNDPLFKTGIEKPFNLIQSSKSSNTSAIQHPEINFNMTFKPDSSLQEVIIQGIQIQGYAFMTCTTAAYLINSDGIDIFTFKNIYFKDCIHTITSKHQTSASEGVFGGNREGSNGSKQGGSYLLFNNCKISIHVHANEYFYDFDLERYHWTNCSRYIEYSDIDDTTAPGGQSQKPLFGGTVETCSTIVKNFAFLVQMNTQNKNYIIKNTINSSWDIEFNYVYYSATSSTGSYKMILILNNCFASAKINHRIFVTDTPAQDIYLADFQFSFVSSSGDSSTGVNIFNIQNPNDWSTWEEEQLQEQEGNVHIRADANPNVKQLSDEDCRNPNILKYYGFFVTTAYEFHLLDSQPSNWSTNYTSYFFKLNEDYYPINTPTAPSFQTNTYYEKIFLT